MDRAGNVTLFPFSAQPVDVNARGESVGVVQDAFSWRDSLAYVSDASGVPRLLSEHAYPVAVNDRGDVLGVVLRPDYSQQVVIWRVRAVSRLPKLEVRPELTRAIVDGAVWVNVDERSVGWRITGSGFDVGGQNGGSIVCGGGECAEGDFVDFSATFWGQTDDWTLYEAVVDGEPLTQASIYISLAVSELVPVREGQVVLPFTALARLVGTAPDGTAVAVTFEGHGVMQTYFVREEGSLVVWFVHWTFQS
jgi:hypothetical protein